MASSCGTQCQALSPKDSLRGWCITPTLPPHTRPVLWHLWRPVRWVFLGPRLITIINLQEQNQLQRIKFLKGDSSLQFSVSSVAAYAAEGWTQFYLEINCNWHSAWALAKDPGNRLSWNLQAHLLLLPTPNQGPLCPPHTQADTDLTSPLLLFTPYWWIWKGRQKGWAQGNWWKVWLRGKTKNYRFEYELRTVNF